MGVRKGSVRQMMREFTNSPLVNLINLSPHMNSPRNQPISKITWHHFAGNPSIEAVSDFLRQSSRRASYNYGVGSDGRIVLIVEERNRCWGSSSAWNDHRAVVIGVANNTREPHWTVSDTAFESAINLTADVCKRNGIKELVYDGTRYGSKTRHNFFSATLCPGPYLQSRLPVIVDIVNERLATGVDVTIGGVTLNVPAKNVGGRWVLSLPEGPEGQPQPDVLLRVVLERFGLQVNWNEATESILTVPKRNTL